MKVWVSKYALSDGIQEFDNMEEIAYEGGARKYAARGMYFFRIGTEAHLSPEEAKVAAEAKRKKKIASLHKQIAKLEGMRF